MFKGNATRYSANSENGVGNITKVTPNKDQRQQLLIIQSFNKKGVKLIVYK